MSSYKNEKMDFEEITFKHMKELYSVATRLTKNPDEAEDLIQDTYLKAYRFFHKFQKGTNIKAWLYKIMIRLFYTKYRKDKLELIRTEPLKDDEFVSSEADPENIYLERLNDEEVLAAIDRLPQHSKTIILLADIEELSYQDISKILKVPIGTIMSRLHRARKRLANELRSYAMEKGIISSSKK
jgi:RNA polymerase sigma-70 factor (ECF subfamily)